MASNFKIGATVETLTSLDLLTTPVPNPNPVPAEYMSMVRLGDLTLKGMGPRTVTWNFPLIDVDEVAQLETFKSTSAIYIITTDRFDDFKTYEVLMNWPQPAQDGSHVQGLKGYRNGLQIEFIILSEVTPS